MKLFNKLHWGYVIISFLFGLLFCYYIKPYSRTVIHYPNIYNTQKVLYKDSANNCYKYRAQSIPCPDPSDEAHKQITDHVIS